MYTDVKKENALIPSHVMAVQDFLDLLMNNSLLKSLSSLPFQETCKDTQRAFASSFLILHKTTRENLKKLCKQKSVMETLKKSYQQRD